VNDIKHPIDPVEIYNRYVRLESDSKDILRNEESKGRYSASGAGLCKRKQWYSYHDYERDATDSQGLRKMRLGSMVGQDFDSAINWFLKSVEGARIKGHDINILIEHPVEHDELYLLGHFDLLVIDEKDKGYLYDYKTCHEFTYRKAVGKILSKTNDKDNYAYQLGTYAFMIEESKDIECDEVVHMENIYINKNDSLIVPKVVDQSYKTLAKEYWKEIQLNQLKDSPPPFGLHNFAPTYKWECEKYCNYSSHCDSPFKK